ncbi:hypothetical protein [Actinophytocola sp.]|uniref:hypothetical protein n=1 Tax=Actinophytocola sp. TaxID=1872138 RepID=UPI002D7F6F16|nr:hypothetical protein [Actinophytocola sp.]HET9144000.1 hypothetical protein [Actinophytocola sp.]
MTEPPAARPDDPPEPRPPARGRMRVLGALSCVAAAALTMIATFQPLVTARLDRTFISVTSWAQRVELNGSAVDPEVQVPEYGLALTLAAALLFVAALLGLRAARSAGLTAVVAAAFLSGTAAALGLQQRWWLEGLLGGPDPDLPPGTLANYWSRTGAGLWTLLAATGLAIVAAMVTWRATGDQRRRTHSPAQPAGTAAVVHRLPDAPPDEPAAEYR